MARRTISKEALYSHRIDMTEATILWTGGIEAMTFGAAKAEVESRRVARQ